MACPQCGRAVAEQDRFCGGCGTALADSCRRCGRTLGADIAFCTGCGTARSASKPAAPSNPTEDRRRVSVLFIDLVGFTPYAEQADPEIVREMQNSFYATARRVVSQHGGVVEKYIGDAVMALFGAPVATETDALRCVRAGLELQRALAETGSPAEGDLQFRVGVATGEALVDVAAARHGGQAIVAGDVVNVAARLQSVAPAGGVLVCGQTRALTSEVIRYAARPATTLRGRTAPTEVWLALAPLPRKQADPAPDPTPLVDREHELGLLTGALRRVVRDRTPQLVTIFGDAGIGKSRLVRELRQRAGELAGTTVVWHTGHCPPFGENVTYAGLADIVKGEAGILETDSAELARSRLRRAVSELVYGPEADRLTAALGPLVGLPGGQLPAEEAESAWRRFLVALSARRGPTVLVFEDLHWADEPMRRFIELLAATAHDVPLLVLGTARPELIDRDASWAGTISGALTITLRRLRSASMNTLYGHLLGQVAFPAEELRPLVELADGNPLYAQEYVRMLAERGMVRQATTGWYGGHGPPMPDNVHAVIANRVDLLDPADRAVLQAAAVVGMRFWPGAVAAALGHAAGSVERSLRRLEQRGFISEVLGSGPGPGEPGPLAGQGEFRFGHVLVRDVCYQRLPRTERVARHERTADWLEHLTQQRDTDLAEVLAHHRWAACEIARTVGAPPQRYAPPARSALHLAARRAYALHALDAAANHTARALTLFGGPEPAEPAAEPERLRLELLATEISFYRDRASFLAGGGTDQLQALARQLTAAATPAEGSGGAVEAGAAAARAWTLLGQLAWLGADRTAALDHLTRAIALFDPLPDSPEKVDAHSELGRLHMLNYECDRAIAVSGVAAETAQRLGLAEAAANARITAATTRYESGDPYGLTELRQVAELCRTQQLLALPRAVRNLAHLVQEEGDWPAAEALFVESSQLQAPGSHGVHIDYSLEIIRAYHAGDLAALAEISDSLTGQPGNQWTGLRGARAMVRALRDEPAADDDEAGMALAAARASGFHRTLWGGLAMTALCRALQHRPAEAAALLAELATAWPKVSVIASGEWVRYAAFAAALTGAEPAEALRVPLAAAPHQTRWSRAALRTLSGVLAGDQPVAAAEHHLAAAGLYQQIPAVADQMLALALAAGALVRGGCPERAAPIHADLRDFADRQGATRLLRIAAATTG